MIDVSSPLWQPVRRLAVASEADRFELIAVPVALDTKARQQLRDRASWGSERFTPTHKQRSEHQLASNPEGRALAAHAPEEVHLDIADRSH